MLGTFTQEDPIGLAGGMNLYGFAAGDPVNYSDPMGLCVGPLVVICPEIIHGILAAGAATMAFVAARSMSLGQGPHFSNSEAADEPETPGPPPAAAPADETRVTPGEAADAVTATGASVEPHTTKHGEGALIRWVDGTVTDIRVETHPIPGSKGVPVTHGNVDTKTPDGKIVRKHITP